MRSKTLEHSQGAQWRAGRAGVLQRALAALRARTLWVTLAALVLWLLLVPQLPLRYMIDVGYEEGYGSDLPYLQNFNTAEQDTSGTYRWTRGDSRIVVPGVGRRALAVELDFGPVSAEAMAVGPQSVEIWGGARLISLVPLDGSGRSVIVQIPSDVLNDGRLVLELRSATFRPPGDPRELGTPLNGVRLETIGGSPVAPDWSALGLWLASAVLIWAMLTLCIADARLIRMLFAAVASLIGLAAWLDLPRWAFGAWPALLGISWALALALLLRYALPALAQRLDIALPNYAAGGLALLGALAFALRYGGRLYPHSMHGDIGWHTNRFNEALWGTVYILSRNRGIDFAYPPGPYLLVAPLTLIGVEVPALLQFGAALVDALSVVLVYVLASKVARPAVGLLAAAIYSLTAATFMTTWWSFDTHIYSQFLLLVALTTVVLASERWLHKAVDATWRWTLASALALLLVFVGHFGFFINTVLLGGLAILALLVQSGRGSLAARRLLIPMSLAYGGALIVAGVFFYSAYAPLLIAQAQTAASGGLTELADREPIGRAVLWRNLWSAGFVAHYGLFPVLLAPLGAWMLVRRWAAQKDQVTGIVWVLLLGTFAVSALFAAMPFVTQVNSSTRWLMFAAWAIAVSAALAVDRLWQQHRMSRPILALMALVVLANTMYYWLGPMLWRIRPPEPF